MMRFFLLKYISCPDKLLLPETGCPIGEYIAGKDKLMDKRESVTRKQHISYLAGLAIIAGLAMAGWLRIQDVATENEHLAARLAVLEIEQTDLAVNQQKAAQFQTAAGSALQHLILTEAQRVAPPSQSLLHRTQADDSTINSPFSILSEHFATKAYVDGKVANLQSQIDNLNTSGAGLSCRIATTPNTSRITLNNGEFCIAAKQAGIHSNPNGQLYCANDEQYAYCRAESSGGNYSSLGACSYWIICRES